MELPFTLETELEALICADVNQHLSHRCHSSHSGQIRRWLALILGNWRK